MTHFISGEEENFPDGVDLTEGAKETLKVICQANPGIKMKVVLPHLVVNHDGSGQFLMRNKNDASHQGKKQELLLTHSTSLKGEGTRSIHSEPEQKTTPTGGMRLKHSATTSAVGQKARPFYSFTGLTEQELPKDKHPDGCFV